MNWFKHLPGQRFEQVSDDGFRQTRDIVLIQVHLARAFFFEHESLSQAPDDPESIALHFQRHIQASRTCSCQPSMQIFGNHHFLIFFDCWGCNAFVPSFTKYGRRYPKRSLGNFAPDISRILLLDELQPAPTASTRHI